MASSPPPKDPLALGRHIVHELDLTDSTDTLSRWLAHELSELILQAESAESEAERDRARREAARIVTILWRRRSALPGRVYPLAPFRRLVDTLALLWPSDAQQWWRTAPADRDVVAVFQAFARLMGALMLARVPQNEAPPLVSGAAFDALSPDERVILEQIRAWMGAADPDVHDFTLAPFLLAIDPMPAEAEPISLAEHRGESMKVAGEPSSFADNDSDAVVGDDSLLPNVSSHSTAFIKDDVEAGGEPVSNMVKASGTEGTKSAPLPELLLIDALQQSLSSLRATIEASLKSGAVAGQSSAQPDD
jgi:hypothetical protein